MSESSSSEPWGLEHIVRYKWLYLTVVMPFAALSVFSLTSLVHYYSSGDHSLFKVATGASLPEGAKVTATYDDGAWRETEYLFVVKGESDEQCNSLLGNYFLYHATPENIGFSEQFNDHIPQNWKSLILYRGSGDDMGNYIDLIYEKEKKTIYIISHSM